MTQYQDMDFLDIKKNIKLTKDISTGKIYVKKYLRNQSQYEIYMYLKLQNFSGIPKIIDIFTENDYYVLIEEYIEGKTLQQIIDEKSMIFTPERTEEIMRFLCNTLKPIHKAKIVHRDISASNIIYSFDNHLYLIDFGNSRTVKSGQSTDTEYIGTQNYAAPEQFGFAQSDRRTDIFSIGVLCNVLLTGGKYPNEQMYKGKFTKVIKRCTAVKPKDRYRNVTQLKIGMFRMCHRFFTSTPMIIFYIYAILWFALSNIGLLWYIHDDIKINKQAPYMAIATSSPADKAYRRWSDIENCIADGNFDEAQKRLDAAVAEGLTGYNIYMLYSKNYEAQHMYDKAAQTLIDYTYNIMGIESLKKESPIYKRLEYLYPNCSDTVHQDIDTVKQAVK